MASSLFALLDDIASVLDDVSVLAKAATKKTAGVLGDDLALNAQQVAGVKANRELPVVWAVAKGSMVNKAILVPAALAISAIAPWAIVPLLMIGGLFLCYEGFEKIWHKLMHRAEEEEHRKELHEALADPGVDFRSIEKDKIKGAVRTDFILSAEIIVITLGTVAAATFGVRVAVLVGIALLMTVGVYGLVAGIVKLDDAGLYLTQRSGKGVMSIFVPRPGCRHHRVRAVAHEISIDRRHRCHVSRRRRHPVARVQLAGSLDQGHRQARYRDVCDRDAIGRDGSCARQHDRGHRRRRHCIAGRGSGRRRSGAKRMDDAWRNEFAPRLPTLCFEPAGFFHAGMYDVLLDAQVL